MRRGADERESMARGSDLDLEGAASALDRLLADETPREPVTKAAKIRELQPKIEALREKGYSWAEIAATLSEVGGVSKDTLRHIVGGHRSAPKKVSTKRKRTAEEKKGAPPAQRQSTQEPTETKGAFGTHDLGKGMG